MKDGGKADKVETVYMGVQGHVGKRSSAIYVCTNKAFFSKKKI